MSRFSHFNQAGEAHMVDVGHKQFTQRTAIASGYITMQAETLRLIQAGDHKKGDVLGVARIAGIMASKKTAELIPLCHPIPINHVDIELNANTSDSSVHCKATVSTNSQTGVEMEALMAVQVTLLTVYDMCKAVDKGMMIKDVRLFEKTGGKSGDWRSE